MASYYDLFFTPPTQYRLRYPFQKLAFANISPRPALERWAKGSWLRSKNCPSCDLSWITNALPPALEPLLLQGFINAPKRDHAAYWQLANALSDPRGKPVLEYLLAQEKEPDLVENARSLVAEVGKESNRVESCCDQTQKCLQSQIRFMEEKTHAPTSRVLPSTFLSKAELDSYLAAWVEESKHDPVTSDFSKLEVKFTSDDQRSANVLLNGKQSKWTHWLGCWRPE